jgi:DNA-binding transcriptional regulator YiaG
MPNIASVLKSEISRLARKEARAHVAPLKKANAQYRRDIAALKREMTSTKRQLERLTAQDRRRRENPAPAAADRTRFSPDWLRSHRDKLDLAAADYAELVGVSPQTIYNWEQGRSRPRDEQLAALAAIRAIGKREAARRLDA